MRFRRSAKLILNPLNRRMRMIRDEPVIAVETKVRQDGLTGSVSIGVL